LLVGADKAAIDFSRQHGRGGKQIMTANPITIREDASLEEIVRLMERHKVKRFPVMNGDEIVGMVTLAEFLTAIANVSFDRFGASRADEDIRASVVATLSQAPWRPCALNVSVHEGIVALKGTVRNDNAHKAAIVAAETVSGVKRIDDQLLEITRPPPEEDYGGGDFVSLQEEASTADDEPL
jgi:CBS domain-containing protein